jgi:nucleotide-binding universal stress UspA family protein
LTHQTRQSKAAGTVAILTIDDDVMRTAQQRAAELLLPVDRLVSDLLRTAREPADDAGVVIRLNSSGFPVIYSQPGTPPITLEKVQEAQDADDAAAGW